MDNELLHFCYLRLAYPVVRALLDETLVIGLIAFAFGQVRHGFADPSMVRHGDFWRRLLLLFGVLLFVSNIVLQYDVHLVEAAPLTTGTIEAPVGLVSLTLLLLPIDLLSALVVASLFGVLAIRDLRGSDEKKRPRNLRQELKLLFLLTGSLHALYMVWWFLFSLYTGTIFEGMSEGFRHQPTELPFLWNGGFHFVFLMAHLTSFAAWRHITSRVNYLWRSNSWDWGGLSGYLALILIVYVVRLGHYIATYQFVI